MGALEDLTRKPLESPEDRPQAKRGTKRSTKSKRAKKQAGDNPRQSVAPTRDEVQDALNSLKPAERHFVEAYTNPESPTYSQKMASAGQSHPNLRYPESKATDLLQKPRIQTAVHAVLERVGFAASDRASLLTDMAKGKVKQKVEAYDAEGRLIGSQERPWDALKAVDIANKMDGTYSRADAAVDVEKDELKRFFRKHARSLLSE